MSVQGWIGVDLDGTLAEYHEWQGLAHIGKPIPAMLLRVKEWLAQGKEVRIFTARASGPIENQQLAVHYIERWCEQHVGQKLVVTNVKDYGMIELYDDRAHRVEYNTGRIISLLEPENPEPTP